MRGLWIIAWKEIRDNLRDKRALFFAFIYGPLLMPSLMLGPMVVVAGKHVQSYDTGKTYHVWGGERAPNLLAYLKSQNLDAEPAAADFKSSIRAGDIDLVLEISEGYGDDLLAGKAARVTLHYNHEDQDSQNLFWQLRGEIDGYSRTIAGQRMAVRGFDQSLLRPLDILDNDLSGEQFGAGMLANILLFLVIFSCMMGGFYLAIDITAGERERLSLEPLLSLPLRRFEVALGKYTAIVVFCTVSYLLPIISVGIWSIFLPDQFFGSGDIPGLVTFVKIALLCLPLSFLMASFLMAVASWTKSTKEAQTQMGFAMLVPMTPFFLVQFLNIEANPLFEAVPILSQYLLADKILVNSAYPLSALWPGALTSLVLAFALLAVSVGLYRRDAILGN